MILDSSAIIAILVEEPGWEVLFGRLTDASFRGVGAPTLVETGIVLSSKLDGSSIGLLSRFAGELEIATVHFGEDHWREALDAFHRFGKGRHPARLNLGECMTYAVAKLSGEPLLCMGDDFPQTDLVIA